MKAFLPFIVIVLAGAGIYWLNARLSSPEDASAEEAIHSEPSPMQTAALAWLESLNAEQRAQAVLPFADEYRYEWHFTPKPRKGVTLRQMNEEQRGKAEALLKTALSEKGFAKTEAIRHLESILKVLENRSDEDDYRDPEKYFYLIFGDPASGEPWGWRFEGHHQSFNFSSVTNELVSATPFFLGSNPGKVLEGPEKDLEVLKDEQALGRKLLGMLDAGQLGQALISDTAPAEIVTQVEKRPKLDQFEGLAVSDMNAEQRAVVQAILDLYLSNLKPELSQSQRDKIAAAGMDKIHFAWAGSQEIGEPHYYRLHGPSFVLEYDNVQNNANHVHTVWRDFEGDFGEDLLRAHHATHHE